MNAESQNALEAHEALMQFLYRAPIGLVQATLDGTIEMANPMAANLLLPLAAKGELGNLFDTLVTVAPQLRQDVACFPEASGSICESLRLSGRRRAGGGPLTFLSLSIVKLDATRLMAMISDITLEVQREDKGILRRLMAAARLDALTQTPNRTVACEAIQHAIARTPTDAPCDSAVLYVNCDRFRHVNESLGHESGNEVLRVMAERLRATLRQPDESRGTEDGGSMVARIGGDEFAIVVSDLFVEDVHAVSQRIIKVLDEPYGVRGREVLCKVSMGVVLRHHVRGDAESVLQDAGTAMLEAKRSGGGRYVVFSPQMRERAARRNAIESELRKGIGADELFVVYQPLVGLQAASGRLDRSAGVEALVRWRHPTRGIVPPLEFIGIAEECGLIAELGHYVLKRACDDFVHLHETEGVEAPRLLAVNLSRNQLIQPGFVDSVRRILESSRIAPQCLQLEVTESLAAQDEIIQVCLRDLKSLGLTLALDDFGTGYSSLSSLHQLPVDTIKIDRSFVDEAATSAHHRVLIEATVRVAKSLHMSTVAEGIETRAQADLVRELGCEKGQGYYFSKPLSIEDLRKWLGNDPGEAAVEHCEHSIARAP